MNQPAKNKFGLIAILTLTVIGLLGIGYWFSQGKLNTAETLQVQHIVDSEELLLELSKKLKHLSRSIANFQLPDPAAQSIFDDNIQIDGQLVAGESAGTWKLDPSAGAAIKSPAQLRLWKSVLQSAKYFENAKFYNIRGQFSDSTRQRYATHVGFEALAKLHQGDFVSLHGMLELTWSQVSAENGKSDWLIDSWTLKEFRSVPAENLSFVDELGLRIDKQSTLEKASRSKHTELTSRLAKGGEYFLPAGVQYPFFFPDVTLEHPGVSIVDIDSDGQEDIFVAMQYDSNLLFHNQGDGTFVESARKFGLDISGDCTCALFADFDNDGDPDVFIGRGRQPSQYLKNYDGKFVESDSLIGTELPAMVSSISASDFNNDGLLDVYISTYSPIEAEYENNRTPSWVDLFMTQSQADKYLQLQDESHSFLARTGPPNLLLQNSGSGGFSVADANDDLELWKMTFQASWHDFDDDGDPDLYVANDYHRDNFFRNDGDAGFVDVTEELGLTEMGFGMGVSFGDYDLDGQTDIYVSNMFSKAGQRILSQVEDIDIRFKEMAKGNFLYRKQNGKYELVSGFEKPALQVAKAGWSWGGQFADFNNDGYRDIYVVNGYYTAPDDIAIEVDL